MTLEIHGMGGSAPCRIPYMTCEVLGLDYKMVNCDLMKGDHKTPEYLKVNSIVFKMVKIKVKPFQMNPQHTIPTMKDGDFCMNESRPIATYLASKYGKDDKLYPKDVTTRAIVDQRLYFDMGVFYKAFGDNVVSITNLTKLQLT